MLTSTIFAGGDSRSMTVVCELFFQPDVAAARTEVFGTSTQTAGSSLSALWSVSTTAGATMFSALWKRENPLDLQRHFQQRLFDVINAIPVALAQREPIYYQNMPLPPILLAFYKNQLTAEQTRAAIYAHLEQSTSAREQPILKAITDLIVDPAKLARTIEPSPEALILLRACREYNPKTQFALSANTNTLMNLYTNKKFEEFFKFFSTADSDMPRIICSGDIGHLKPSDEFFRLERERLTLDPHQTIRIETEQVHAQRAREAGYSHTYCLSTVQSDGALRKELLTKLRGEH